MKPWLRDKVKEHEDVGFNEPLPKLIEKLQHYEAPPTVNDELDKLKIGEKATPVWPTAEPKLLQLEPVAPDEDYANMLTLEQPDSSKVCEW